MNILQMRIAERVLNAMGALNSASLKFINNVYQPIDDTEMVDIRSCPRINFITPQQLADTTKAHIETNIHHIAKKCSSVIIQNYQEKCIEHLPLSTHFPKDLKPAHAFILAETEDHLIIYKAPGLSIRCFPINTEHYYIKNDYHTHVMIDTAIFYTLPDVDALKRRFIRLNKLEFGDLFKKNPRPYLHFDLPLICQPTLVPSQ